METIDAVLAEVERACRERHVPMLGREKAVFLAELVEKTAPSLIVECGTAIGYSGLWLARALKTVGKGRIITVEINPERAREARENFARAGVADLVDSRIGDAKEALRTIRDSVDFLLLDNDYQNYYPDFLAIESRLVDGAVIVADNVGIGASGMADYLSHVRARFDSETHWFDLDLPWVKRDAMEVTVFRSDGVKE